MKKINAAIIGLGVGEKHISGYESENRCSIFKLCDFDKKKIIDVSKRYSNYNITMDPDEILEDPQIDVVSIASYDNFHAKQVIKAIENGKHVFVEKPICLTKKELSSIVKAMKNNPNVKLSSNFVLRRVPKFEKLKEEIEKNKFGKIYYIEGDYNYGRIHKLTKGWRGEIPFYSVMHGGGIHLIDLLKWLTKKRVVEVIGIGNKITTKNSNFKYLDMVTSLLKFEDDVIGKVTANFGSVTPHHHRLSLYGSDRTFYSTHESDIYHNERGNAENKIELEYKPDNSQKKNVLKSFVASILDNSKPDVSGKEVIDVMAISLAIEKSIISKKWEKVDYINCIN